MRYWAELGGHKLTNPPKETPRITKILNGIASFEYTIQNNANNRAILAAHLTEDFVIKSKYGGSWFPWKFSITFGGKTILTGSIDCDNIEYLSKYRIRLTGYVSFVDLSYLIFKWLVAADASNVDKVFDLDASVPTWTGYTTAANNDTINDVELTFGAVDDVLYIGQDETFLTVKIKYTTKGVYDATVVWEYWNGSAWVVLNTKDEMTYIDESRGFTKDAGTYYLILSGKPSDWAKNTVNSIEKYWIRVRISAWTSTTTAPKLDRIQITDADVCRVQFDNVAADTILGHILEGTGYTEDATDQCPSGLISMRGEYESKLRWIAAIAKSLTWGDSGEEKPYDWWIDTDKKVHFKQQRGDMADISHIFPLTFPVLFGGLGVIDTELTMLNKREGYQGIANRIFGLGSFDGINQRRAIVEDTASQDSYDLREIYHKDMRFSHESSLKELVQKELTDSKAPLKEVSCEITTKYWIEEELEVGDEVVIHQPEWNVSNQIYRITRAVIGYSRTRLDLSVAQTHLENIRSALQRQVDIDDVWMAGATNIYQVGPLLDNFERVDNTTVYPLTLNIYIPEEAKYINKVKLNWKLDKFRVGSKTTADESAHTHSITGKATESESAHTHSITGKATESESAHTHGFIGKTTGIQSGNWKAITQISSLTNKVCAQQAHTHLCNGEGNWTSTPGESSKTAHYVNTFTDEYFLHGNHDHSLNAVITDAGSAHSHSITGIATDAGSAHSHSITGIATDAGSAHSHGIGYGMQEDTDTSPIMELKVNGTTISDNYNGDQHDISITNHVSSGWNTIILQPKTSEHKRGRAQLDGIVQVFIESK